jgi:hypothetical protein
LDGVDLGFSRPRRAGHQILLCAEVSFSSLDRRVLEQHLDLLQLPTRPT